MSEHGIVEDRIVQALKSAGISVINHPLQYGATVRIYQAPEFGEAFGFGGKDLAEALKKVLKYKGDRLTLELQEMIMEYITQRT